MKTVNEEHTLETPAAASVKSPEPAQRPVIVLCGSPRSGTSWLGKILDSHPDTLYRHEPEAVGRPPLPTVMGSDPTKEEIGTIRDYVQRLPQICSAHTVGPLPVLPKSYRSFSKFQLYRLDVLAAKLIARLRSRPDVPCRMKWKESAFSHLVWKSIDSVGRLGAISRSLTNCKIVHIVRHPCGHMASMIRGVKQGKMVIKIGRRKKVEILADLPQAKAQGVTLEYLMSLSELERAAWSFATLNEKAMDDLQGRDNCCTVRYEDFCEAPFEASRRLFDQLGLQWNRSTEDFIRYSTSADTKRFYGVRKNPKNSSQKWQTELSRDEIRQITDAAKKTRMASMYDLD